MNPDTLRILRWAMTVATSLAAFGAVMSESPTQSHRLWMAVSLAVMIVFNGWIGTNINRSPHAEN